MSGRVAAPPGHATGGAALFEAGKPLHALFDR
jgi:hypothetical protein